MNESNKPATRKRSGIGVLEWLVLVIFIGVIVAGLLPQLDLRTARQRSAEKQAELEAIERRLSTLTQAAQAAASEFDSAKQRLAEQNTLTERAKAAKETEETLRRSALADRLTQESLHRSLVQTNQVLTIGLAQMRQDMSAITAQESTMRSRTNALTVALQEVDFRLKRLQQEEKDAQARIEQQNLAIAAAIADNKRLRAEGNQVDIDLKQEQARLNTVRTDIGQESKRIEALRQQVGELQRAKTKAEADRDAVGKTLQETQAILAQELTALKTVQGQVDNARAESIAHTGQTALAQKELTTLQGQIEMAKAEQALAQTELKRLQADIAAKNATLKQAEADLLKAREAMEAARLGATAAQQAREDALREEGATRTLIEQLLRTLDELKKAMREASVPPQQP